MCWYIAKIIQALQINRSSGSAKSVLAIPEFTEYDRATLENFNKMDVAMSKNGTVNELFELAIEVEKAAETLYCRFAEMFAHEQDVADFWKKYADEERGHAAFLERTRNKLTAESLSARGNTSMLKSARKNLESLVNYGLQTVQTLEDAFQLATELETSETNTIFEFMITTFSTDELVKSHGFLRTQLKKHSNMLADEFPTRFKSRLMRKDVNALEMAGQ